MENSQNKTPEEINTKWYTPLTTVTSLSKLLALILFIALPFIGFLLGYTFKSATVETVVLIEEKPAENTEETPDESTDIEPNPTEQPDMVACTMDAKMCPDGSFVGRTGPDCEFEACPSEIMDQTEAPAIECPPESRGAVACTKIFKPVCASVQVECITTPCPPVQETKSNSCTACSDERVLSYTEGSCEV